MSETPAASPSPTALSDDELLALIPEDARRDDFFGATAFVEFYVDLYPALFVEKPDGDGIDNYLIPDAQITDYLTTRAARHTWTDTTRK